MKRDEASDLFLAENILEDYAEKDSLVDMGNLFFAASTFSDAFDALKQRVEQLEGSPIYQEMLRAKARIVDLEKALTGLKRGECWCDVGIGHPLMMEHSVSCKFARNALVEWEQMK